MPDQKKTQKQLAEEALQAIREKNQSIGNPLEKGVARVGEKSAKDRRKQMNDLLRVSERKTYAIETVEKAFASNSFNDDDDMAIIQELKGEFFNPADEDFDARSIVSHVVTNSGMGKVPILNKNNLKAAWGTLPPDEAGSIDVGGKDYRVKELKAKVQVPVNFVNDSTFDIVSYIKPAVKEKFNALIFEALLKGDENTSMEGLIPKIAAVNKVEGDLSASNLLKTFFKPKGIQRRVGSFIVPDASMYEVADLRDGNGRMIYTANMVESIGETLLGKRLISTETLTNEFVFGNFKKYLIIEKPEMGLIIDPFGDNADNGMISIYITIRLTGHVLDPFAFSILKREE